MNNSTDFMKDIIRDIPIGYKFKSRSNRDRVETVVDRYETRSTVTGDLIRVRYVTEYEFVGQIVTNSDVCKVTIQRGDPA